MAIEIEMGQGKPAVEDRPFRDLRATPEELERLRAMAPPPRSLEEWLRPARQATEDDLAELEWFLQEREALRRQAMEHQEDRLTGPEE
jgi:hypothetical protein